MHPDGTAISVAWPTDMTSLSDSRTSRVSTMHRKTSYTHKLAALLLTAKRILKY
jgi:hypothetical protein